MVFLKLALSDPDVTQSSSATATPASYFRIEDNFSEDMTISAVFLESCETTFLHLPNSVNRGLEMTTFTGRDMDSGEVISVSVTDSTVRWVEMLREFSSLFHVTFKLHTKFFYSTPIGSSVAVPCYSLFDSLTDRRTARLAREDNERGEFSPLNRLEWCSLWTLRTFNHEPYIEIQWRAVINLFFIPNKVRFQKVIIENKDHPLYIFIGHFCILLRSLNKRWTKIVACEASFGTCPVFSVLFPSSDRPYSSRDDENHIDNPGASYYIYLKLCPFCLLY